MGKQYVVSVDGVADTPGEFHTFDTYAEAEAFYIEQPKGTARVVIREERDAAPSKR